MPRLEAINARLGMDTKGYERGTGRVVGNNKKINRSMNTLRGSVGKAGLAVSGLVAGFATFAGARALTNSIRSTIEYGSELSKLSRDLGISAQALEAWRFAAESADVDVNKVNKGLKQLTGVIGQARAGTGALATNLARTNPEFLAMIQNADSTSDAVGVYTDFIGKADKETRNTINTWAVGTGSALDFGRALLGVAEANEFLEKRGLALTTEDAENLERINQLTADLSKTISGSFNKAVADSSDEIEELVGQLDDLALQVIPDLVGGLKDMTKFLAGLESPVSSLALSLGIQAGGYGLGAILLRMPGWFKVAGLAVITFTALFPDLTQKIDDARSALIDWFADIDGSGALSMGDITDEIKDINGSLIEAREELERLTLARNAYSSDDQNVVAGNLDREIEEERKKIAGLEARLNVLREVGNSVSSASTRLSTTVSTNETGGGLVATPTASTSLGNRVSPADSAAREIAAIRRQFLEQTIADPLRGFFGSGRLNEDQSFVLELEEAETVADRLGQIYKEWTDEVTERYSIESRYRNLLNDLSAVAVNGAETFGQTLEQYLNGAISLADGLRSIAREIVNDLQRALVVNPAKQAFGQLLSVGISSFLGVPSVGAGGGFTPSSIGSASGLFQPRARGGNVMQGRPYVVGERGAEAFIPGRSGTIIPNDKLGGDTVQNFVFNIAGDADATKIQRAIQQATPSIVEQSVLTTAKRARQSGNTARDLRGGR